MNKTRILLWLSLADLLAMSLWFSGTAVVPQLMERWHAGAGVRAWMTVAVQLGFVAGALLIATFNLPDVFSAKRVIVLSILAGAAANVAFAHAALHDAVAPAILFRALTGVCLAG